jgi:hypothetical protein
MTRRIESLPLFATDPVLGAYLLGPDRVQEFKQMVPLLEARGMPKIDHLMGGRYTPPVWRGSTGNMDLIATRTCRWHQMVSRILTDGNKRQSQSARSDVAQWETDLARLTGRDQDGLQARVGEPLLLRER